MLPRTGVRTCVAAVCLRLHQQEDRAPAHPYPAMTRIQVRLPLGPQPGLNSKSWGPFSTSRPLSSFPTSSPGRAPCSFSLFSIPCLAPRPPEDPKALFLRAPPLDSCTPPHSLQPTVRTQAAQECRAASLLPSPKPLWNSLPRRHAGLQTAALSTHGTPSRGLRAAPHHAVPAWT